MIMRPKGYRFKVLQFLRRRLLEVEVFLEPKEELSSEEVYAKVEQSYGKGIRDVEIVRLERLRSITDEAKEIRFKEGIG